MSARVAAAFEAVPRRGFLPKDQQRFAHHDNALEIGYGATNSQPTTVRNMLHLLEVEVGQRVLDVGSGSAWTTALLAHLVGPEGRVIGVELVPELLEMGIANLVDHWPQASLHQAAPDVLGWPDLAPYDRILVSADASHLPLSLIEQLEPGGVMVVPVRGVMHRISRTPDGHRAEQHGFYSFVPLRGG
ncbi:MAG TPA: methyltransferase domain-containing protein [Nocardioidaceae bacterium]|nr:methyltransferase domain-containing protein [Nocardioidaceae bacterium]